MTKPIAVLTILSGIALITLGMTCTLIYAGIDPTKMTLGAISMAVGLGSIIAALVTASDEFCSSCSCSYDNCTYYDDWNTMFDH